MSPDRKRRAYAKALTGKLTPRAASPERADLSPATIVGGATVDGARLRQKAADDRAKGIPPVDRASAKRRERKRATDGVRAGKDKRTITPSSARAALGPGAAAVSAFEREFAHDRVYARVFELTETHYGPATAFDNIDKLEVAAREVVDIARVDLDAGGTPLLANYDPPILQILADLFGPLDDERQGGGGGGGGPEPEFSELSDRELAAQHAYEQMLEAAEHLRQQQILVDYWAAEVDRLRFEHEAIVQQMGTLDAQALAASSAEDFMRLHALEMELAGLAPQQEAKNAELAETEGWYAEELRLLEQDHFEVEAWRLEYEYLSGIIGEDTYEEAKRDLEHEVDWSQYRGPEGEDFSKQGVKDIKDAQRDVDKANEALQEILRANDEIQEQINDVTAKRDARLISADRASELYRELQAQRLNDGSAKQDLTAAEAKLEDAWRDAYGGSSYTAEQEKRSAEKMLEAAAAAFEGIPLLGPAGMPLVDLEAAAAAEADRVPSPPTERPPERVPQPPTRPASPDIPSGGGASDTTSDQRETEAAPPDEPAREPEPGDGRGPSRAATAPCPKAAIFRQIEVFLSTQGMRILVARWGYSDWDSLTAEQQADALADACSRITNGATLYYAAMWALLAATRPARTGSAFGGYTSTDAEQDNGERGDDPTRRQPQGEGTPPAPVKKRPCPHAVKQAVQTAYVNEMKRAGVMRTRLNEDNLDLVPDPPPDVQLILDRLQAELCHAYTTADEPWPLDDRFFYDVVPGMVRQAVVGYLNKRHGELTFSDFVLYNTTKGERITADILSAVSDGLYVLESYYAFLSQGAWSFAKLALEIFQLVFAIVKWRFKMTFMSDSTEAFDGVTWADIYADLLMGDPRKLIAWLIWVYKHALELPGHMVTALTNDLKRLLDLASREHLTLEEKKEMMELVWDFAHTIAESLTGRGAVRPKKPLRGGPELPLPKPSKAPSSGGSRAAVMKQAEPRRQRADSPADSGAPGKRAAAKRTDDQPASRRSGTKTKWKAATPAQVERAAAFRARYPEGKWDHNGNLHGRENSAVPIQLTEIPDADDLLALSHTHQREYGVAIMENGEIWLFSGGKNRVDAKVPLGEGRDFTHFIHTHPHSTFSNQLSDVDIQTHYMERARLGARRTETIITTDHSGQPATRRYESVDIDDLVRLDSRLNEKVDAVTQQEFGVSLVELLALD